MNSNFRPTRRLVLVVGLLGTALLSCGREITGPVATAGNALLRRAAAFAVDPWYELAVPVELRHAALSQVAFEKVRITIRREDGSIALDTVVTFPVGADSLSLTLEVPLLPNTPASGVPMSLRMGYVNAAGDTVFRGSAALTVAPSSPGSRPAAVSVPVAYTGPGAGAASVRIAPATATGVAGNTVTFSAAALDAAGTAMPGTPIIFSSSDATIATIDAASGVATLGQRRGSATITAQTLTGQRASATVSVTLPGSVLTATGGGPALVGALLPVTATVTASDGIAVAGVAVSFAVASGGGTVAPASATTDASGKASATWTLGLTPGVQTLTVGAAGATRTLSATAEALKASKIVVTSSPGNGVLGQTFGVTAQVQDLLGTVVKDFSGTLAVALGTNPAGATLSGTTSAAVSGGAATFSGLSVSKAGKGYVLVVSGGGLAEGSSRAFDMAGPTATKLVFTVQPPASAKAGDPFTVAVAAQDQSGAIATDFSEIVGLQASGGPGGLLGTTSVAAGGGTAAFEGLKMDKPGTYTLTARAGTLTPATATIVVATGDPTQFRMMRGQSQVASAGSTLSPITVRLLDAAGNGVPGRLVTFTVTVGGGTLESAAPPTLDLETLETATDGSPTSFTTTTNAAGEASVLWTLGPLVGTQFITANTAGVPAFNITANASTPPPARLWTGATSSDWHTASNWSPAIVPTPLAVITIPNAEVSMPVISTPVTIGGLVVVPGAWLTNNSTLTIGGSVDAGEAVGLLASVTSALMDYGYYGIVGSGSIILTGTSATLNGMFDQALTINGSYALNGYAVLYGNLTVSGTSAGLRFDGNEFYVEGNFATASGGTVTLTDPDDELYVEGNATFGGGSTVGKLTAGELHVLIDFTQNGAANSFAPSAGFYTEIGSGYYYEAGLRTLRNSEARSSDTRVRKATAEDASLSKRTRRVSPLRAEHAERRARIDRQIAAHARRRLAATQGNRAEGIEGSRRVAVYYSGESNITFANPTSSFFGRLYLAGEETILGSNIKVTGSLETGYSYYHDVRSSTSAARTITSHGADVRDLSFYNVSWILLDGSDVGDLDYVRFYDMDPTVDQFTIARTSDELASCDCSPYYYLYYWSFATPPTTGRYIKATDTNGGPNVLELYMSAPSPSVHGGRISTAGGAKITNWPAQLPTQLVLTTAPSASATSGVAFAQQPVVEVRDASNIKVATATNQVCAILSGGTGTLGGTICVYAVAGVATFTNLSIAGSGPYTLNFTSSGLTGASSSSITVSPALAMRVQAPTGGPSGTRQSPSHGTMDEVQVAIARGRPVVTSSGNSAGSGR